MPQYKVVFAPRAEEQLDHLYMYIALSSGETRADHYVGSIVTQCLSLATFPERGTKRDDIRPNLRTMGYNRSATIAFSINHSIATVTILGVFYDGQNYEAAFDEDQTE